MCENQRRPKYNFIQSVFGIHGVMKDKKPAWVDADDLKNFSEDFLIENDESVDEAEKHVEKDKDEEIVPN